MENLYRLENANSRQTGSGKNDDKKKLDDDHDTNEIIGIDDIDDSSNYINLSEDDAKAVTKAAKWVQDALSVKALNSLWYERLGATYRSFSEYELAISSLTKAVELDELSWRSIEHLAYTLVEKNNDHLSAVSEMEKALKILRRIEKPGEEERSSTLKDLMCLAEWRTNLHQLDSALEIYKEVLGVDPKNYEARSGILKTLLTSGYEERARECLSGMSKKKAEDADVSQLAVTLLSIAMDRNSDVVFTMMFSATQETVEFDILMKDMRQAISFAQKEKQALKQSTLLLHQGIALYHYDQRKERNPQSALTLWEECCSLDSEEAPWELRGICFQASRLICSHHYHETCKSSGNPAIHIQKMKEFAVHRQGLGLDTKTYLGCYYVGQGHVTKAKELFLNDIKSALAILSDEWESNDYHGFYLLANILMHCGQYLDALSAWSLIGPTDFHDETTLLDFENEPTRNMAHDLYSFTQSRFPPEALLSQRIQVLVEEAKLRESKLNAESEADRPGIEAWQKIQQSLARGLAEIDARHIEDLPRGASKKERTGNLGCTCDGDCGRRFWYANDLYCCKVCADIQFCQSCLEQVRAGKLKKIVCNANHDWLHVPK